jgi:hypothetical protein
VLVKICLGAKRGEAAAERAHRVAVTLLFHLQVGERSG